MTVPKEKRDAQLLEKLTAELPGILAWAVKGALEWQETGLNPPQDVVQATGDYRKEMDVVGHFFKDRCVLKDGVYCSKNELYKAYKQWCGEYGEIAVEKRKFGEQLIQKGFSPNRKVAGQRVWRGIGLESKQMDVMDAVDDVF